MISSRSWVAASIFAQTGALSPIRSWESSRTKRCPTRAAYGLESVVIWTFTPTSTGTHLRMEQSGFRPEQQAYQGAKGGWQQFFAALEQDWRGQTEICRHNSKLGHSKLRGIADKWRITN